MEKKKREARPTIPAKSAAAAAVSSKDHSECDWNGALVCFVRVHTCDSD